MRIIEIIDTLYNIQQPLSFNFWTDKSPAAISSFTCKNSCEMILNSFVLTKKITNLTASYANITSRHVGFRTDMAVQFRHKGLTETHDFLIRFSLGIKI